MWFGLWKNGKSTYTPSWIKQDQETYFRAINKQGETLNSISPFCEEAVHRDSLALMEVMKHLKSIDAKHQTVILMQIENEIGLIGSDRDYCPVANQSFKQEIPKVLAEHFNVRGNWDEAFSDKAKDYFMAYYYAKNVEKIAKSAKKVYDLPCYTNAWLKQYPWFSGSYPMGGPIKDNHAIWKIMAPSLFTLAPDIYVPYVADVIDEYSNEENPIFIPEVRKDAVTASYCLYMFSKKNALGYSPFGIEDVAQEYEYGKLSNETLATLNIASAALDPRGTKKYLSSVYKIISGLQTYLHEYAGTTRLQSFIKRSDNEQGSLLHFTNYDLLVTYKSNYVAQPISSGMILELEDDTFILIGMNCVLKFLPKDTDIKKVDILRLEELEITSEGIETKRVLNGDERYNIEFYDEPATRSIQLYKF